MSKRPSSRPRGVREPVQVYLGADDAALLARLATDTGLSKAEILRQGVRRFAREQGVESPMLRYLAEADAADWPTAPVGDHDAALAESFRPSGRRRR